MCERVLSCVETLYSLQYVRVSFFLQKCVFAMVCVCMCWQYALNRQCGEKVKMRNGNTKKKSTEYMQ